MPRQARWHEVRHLAPALPRSVPLLARACRRELVAEERAAVWRSVPTRACWQGVPLLPPACRRELAVEESASADASLLESCVPLWARACHRELVGERRATVGAIGPRRTPTRGQAGSRSRRTRTEVRRKNVERKLPMPNEMLSALGCRRLWLHGRPPFHSLFLPPLFCQLKSMVVLVGSSPT